MNTTTELPSFLAQTGPSAFTLTLSASAAETFMLCPAKYSWSRITGIEAAAPRAGMNYGKAIHLALAERYGNVDRSLSEVSESAAVLLRQHFEANPQPEMGGKGKPEWRTLARAMQAMAAYNEAYPAESWEVLGVEEPFEVTLGEFFPNGTDELSPWVTVKFRGIRDLRVRWHDSIWVVDHKTTTEWSDLTADEGKASFQFMGYAWVERLLMGLSARTLDRIGGVIGNYLVARQPYSEGYKPNARSLPRDQFERVTYPFSDAQLDKWHGRAMRLAQGIWRAWSASEWDQHSTACAHWGRCEYYQLCWETDPQWRLSAAMGSDYRQRTPSPLDEPDI